MGDEQYYLIVEQELKDDKIDKALWAKASALCQGDEQKTRYQYIQLRVEDLKQEASQRQSEATKEKAKKWSILSAKVIGGIAAVSIFIVLCILSYERYQSYLDEELTYRLVCSNVTTTYNSTDNKIDYIINAEEGEKIVHKQIPRRDFSLGLKIGRNLDFHSPEEPHHTKHRYERYEVKITEEQKKISGYFTYQDDITHRFEKTDFVNRLACTGPIFYNPMNSANRRECTREDHGNDKITRLKFLETEGNTYYLTQSEYLRKDPQTDKETEYKCISD